MCAKPVVCTPAETQSQFQNSGPVVLTENLFMDNHADCDFLLSPEGQQTLIDLNVDGITTYLSAL